MVASVYRAYQVGAACEPLPNVRRCIGMQGWVTPSWVAFVVGDVHGGRRDEGVRGVDAWMHTCTHPLICCISVAGAQPLVCGAHDTQSGDA